MQPIVAVLFVAAVSSVSAGAVGVLNAAPYTVPSFASSVNVVNRALATPYVASPYFASYRYASPYVAPAYYAAPARYAAAAPGYYAAITRYAAAAAVPALIPAIAG